MTGNLPVNSPGLLMSDSDFNIGSLLSDLQPSEISEVFTDVCCPDCQSLLRTRLLNLLHQKKISKSSTIRTHESEEVFWAEEQNPTSSGKDSAHKSQNQSHNSSGSASWGTGNGHPLRQKGNFGGLSPASVNSVKHMPGFSTPKTSPAQNGIASVSPTNVLSEDQTELARVSQVGRKKNFVHYEKVGGKKVNILQGLELHTGVFNAEEQKDIVNFIYKLQDMGQKRRLRERTYTEPAKWMRGKGRVTIQFGCCYNYAVDKDGNPPGIIRDEEVDPLPSRFKDMIKRLVRWHVLPPTCVPNSCIVNIYDEGDCIPPHIDHHDFLRPFCTVSFLTESNILFGSNLKIAGPGEFSGPVSIPLPVGSVLILNGNGADIAKHCVPAVQGKRISVTFRRMDDSKLPFKFSTDPDLLNIRPLSRSLPTHSPLMAPHPIQRINIHSSNTKNGNDSNSYVMAKDDFPPLGS